MRGPGRATVALLTGVVVLPIVLYFDNRALVRSDRIPSGCCEYVVVLSSGVAADSSIGRADHDRLRTAIPLARRLRARLVTTRLRHSIAGPTSDFAQGRALDAAGFDRSQWTLLPPFVNSTRDEALAARGVLISVREIVLVTSPSHTRRACAAFERVGFQVHCVPSAETAPLRLRVFSYFRERAAWIKYRYHAWI